MSKDTQISNELTLKCTTVFERQWEALNSNCRFIKHEGGSRSSKTYSICQSLILYCLQNPNKIVSIVRKTGPALSATVYRDFIEVLRNMGIYKQANHRKGAGMYEFDNGSFVEFFSIDDEQKVRGRKRDIGWINEANDITYDDFQQLALRTNDKLIVDYNPSAVQSFLYQLPEDRTVTIHSTYKDNAFIGKTIIEQIESYKESDPDYYTIFALGKRAFSKENVYHEWKQSQRDESMTEFIYAIDHGYVDPFALVKIWYDRNSRRVHVEELVYESYLTVTDILERMELLQIDKTKIIVTETARPEITNDLKRVGYKLINANKAIIDGINVVKSFNVSIDPSSQNIIKENQSYRYKKHNGKVIDQPMDLYNHSLDAIRYGLMYIKQHCLKETNQPTQVYSFNF